jgi:probable HAF family extracellular repeat protein
MSSTIRLTRDQLGVNADGSVVVGMIEASPHEHAFLLDQALGMQDLRHILITEYGLNLTGCALPIATGVSPRRRPVTTRWLRGCW